ncbi:MAG TPA: nitroreductase [Candidatus Acidoferrales bacterium]|nr:nitroreductase [Candidatus Acidoferrales bacterium]
METLIRRRRSIGRSEGELSKAAITELIEAATWAPNHHLTEPWKFTVLTGEGRRKLGEFWAKTRADELALEGDKRDGFMQGEAKKPLRAPVLIVVSTRTDSDPVVAEEDFAATSAAVQNLLLVAAERDFSAMWRTGDIAHSVPVKKYLGLAESDKIVGVVYVGERGISDAQPQTRKPPEISWLDS